MKARHIFICIFLAAATPCRGHEPPPMIEVDFVIEPSSQFDENLNDMQKKKLHGKMVKLLADWCERQYGFLLWKAADYQQSSQSPFRLTYMLSDDPRGSDADNIAGFRQLVDGIEDPAGRPIGPTYRIYHWWESDKRDDEALYARLKKSLNGNIEVHSEAVHENFLKEVPLTDRVIAHEVKKRILVPITYEFLRTSQDSILLVEFIVVDGSDKTQGSMELSSIKKYFGDPDDGSVAASVIHYDVAPITLVGMGEWDPSVSQHMAQGTDFKVKMKKYIRRGLGDLALDP